MAKLSDRIRQNVVSGERAPAREEGSLLPDGIYHAKLERVEEKDTKAGDGVYLNCMWRIDGDRNGAFGNAVMFDQVNIVNPNQQTQSIGLRRFDDLCKGAGLPGHCEDTDDLLGRLMNITVGTRPGQNGYGPSNTIKAVKPFEPFGPEPAGAPGGRPSTPPRQGAPAAEPAAGAPAKPWGRRAA